MAKVFRPSTRESSILNKIESSKEYARRRAINSVRDHLEPLSNAIAMKLVEESLVETTSKNILEEQIANCLEALGRADDFDIDYKCAPMRNLVPHPHVVSLYVTAFVIETAWPLQRKGIVPEEGIRKVLAFRESLRAFAPETLSQAVFHAETLRQFDAFYEARRTRIHDVRIGIPAVMWYVVIVGGLINLSIIWLFDIRIVTQLFLGGMLAFFMGTMIFLIAAMDNPYKGEVSVTSDAFREAYEIMTAGERAPIPGQPGG